MKSLFVVVVLVIGLVEGQLFAFDDEACFTGAEPERTRVVDATAAPVRLTTRGFNFSDPTSTYPPNTTCQWSVSMSDPDGPELMLSFNNFSLQFTSGCRDDYVEVYDSADDSGALLPAGLRICNNDVVPGDITASNKQLFIRFHSNNDEFVYNGFLARVGFELINTACEQGGQFFNNTDGGVFASLDFPFEYRNNEFCTYSFQAPVGMQVELNFLSFDLEGQCGTDYVQIYDSSFGENARSMGQYFSGDLPCKFRSTGDVMYMVFISDLTARFPGFFGAYTFV